MRNIAVCTSKWEGAKKEKFNFDATSAVQTVTISRFGRRKFPFEGSSPITVTSGTKKSCTLIDRAGDYVYQAEPCGRRSGKTKPPPPGNPKNVIIS
jgi:hypothetical protein